MTKNPLLQKTKFSAFNKISAKHFKPAIVKTLKTTRSTIKKLLSQKKLTWSNFVEPFESIHEHLSFIWSTIYHLNAVMGTKEIRAAYEKCLPLITQYSAEISQNNKLYNAFSSITKNKEYQSLDPTQKKILCDKLRDFRLSGVALQPKDKKLFIHLTQRLAELSNKFACNALDSTQNYLIRITKKQTQGLPEHILALGRENAIKKNQKGWLFNLDLPSYQALITYADSRGLRKKIYDAYVTRASSANPFFKKWDNTKIIEEILKIRNKLIKLVSFKTYAEYSLATKMAKNTDQVLDFLYDLAKKSLPSAKKELKELQKFAQKDGIKDLKPWDIAYYEEKQSKEKFKLSQEDLRPYFPIDQVIQGIFTIAKRLYGITIKEKKSASLWHKDVKFFEIYDHKKNLRGRFYMDLYCREYKRGGAWMDDHQTRYRLKNSTIQLPIAFLVCNFSPPTKDKPALITHNDVLTLLHEFGHCLQHLLTRVDHISASGIKGVPWDAVELASQFMENWGWQKEGIQLMSKHYKTKKPLPLILLKRLLENRNYHASLHMLRQLEFSLIDFCIHLLPGSPKIGKIKEIIHQVQKLTRVTPIYKKAQTLHTFSHIFAGGYAAGYYSYKWAEVLSADAFSKFEKDGIFNRKTGKEFLKYILETGGSEDPMVLFEKFRKRPPKIDALLRHNGIVK
ncbi:MAG: M3 family metallopeptidase [Gammaproteobacteria bacterium]|nr:M3 family metallopeptidase [Gammaproteobacteria bacterium]